MRHWHIAGLKAFERIIGSDVRAVSQPMLMYYQAAGYKKKLDHVVH